MDRWAGQAQLASAASGNNSPCLEARAHPQVRPLRHDGGWFVGRAQTSARMTSRPVLRLGRGHLAGACWTALPVQIVLSGPAVTAGLPFSGDPVPLAVELRALSGVRLRHLQPTSTERVEASSEGTVRVLQPVARPALLVAGQVVAFKYRRLELKLVVVPDLESYPALGDEWRSDLEYGRSSPDEEEDSTEPLTVRRRSSDGRSVEWQLDVRMARVSEVLFATATVLVRTHSDNDDYEDPCWLVFDLPSCDLLVRIADLHPHRLRLAPTGEALYGYQGDVNGPFRQMCVWHRSEGFQHPHVLFESHCNTNLFRGHLHCVSAAHELVFADGTVWRAGDPPRSLGRRCPFYPEYLGRLIWASGDEGNPQYLII